MVSLHRNFKPTAYALALGMAALCLPAVRADVIVYSTGFEQPTFTTGGLAGQDGWSQFGPSTATVEDSFAFAGKQAVFVDGGTATQAGPYHVDSTGGAQMVELSAEIAIFTSSNQTEWQFAAIGPGDAFLGGIDVFPDSSIEAITNGFPVIGTFARSTSFTSPTWNSVDLLFDIATQTYSITINGVTLASNVAFCEDSSNCTTVGTTDYQLGIFDSFGATSPGVDPLAPTNDSGYLDNYQVTDIGAVPEPSAVVLLATVLAGVALFSRRKRQIV